MKQRILKRTGGISMSGLRSIEMQVALPRTQTAGKIQDQMQQRSMVAQEHMAQAQEEKDIKQKKTVTETEFKEKNRLDADAESGKGHSHQPDGQRKQNKGEEDEKVVKHPYKGVQFDASW
jgi:hypothetical protein